MTNKQMILLVSLSAILIGAGGILQVIDFIQNGQPFVSLLLTAGLTVLFIMVGQVVRKLRIEGKAGVPFNDERSKKVKLFAAGYAYFYSLLLWLSLFAFKEFMQTDDLLMIGLGGMVLILAASWLWTYNRSGSQE